MSDEFNASGVRLIFTGWHINMPENIYNKCIIPIEGKILEIERYSPELAKKYAEKLDKIIDKHSQIKEAEKSLMTDLIDFEEKLDEAKKDPSIVVKKWEYYYKDYLYEKGATLSQEDLITFLNEIRNERQQLLEDNSLTSEKIDIINNVFSKVQLKVIFLYTQKAGIPSNLARTGLIEINEQDELIKILLERLKKSGTPLEIKYEALLGHNSGIIYNASTWLEILNDYDKIFSILKRKPRGDNPYFESPSNFNLTKKPIEQKTPSSIWARNLPGTMQFLKTINAKKLTKFITSDKLRAFEQRRLSEEENESNIDFKQSDMYIPDVMECLSYLMNEIIEMNRYTCYAENNWAFMRKCKKMKDTIAGDQEWQFEYVGNDDKPRKLKIGPFGTGTIYKENKITKNCYFMDAKIIRFLQVIDELLDTDYFNSCLCELENIPENKWNSHYTYAGDYSRIYEYARKRCIKIGHCLEKNISKELIKSWDKQRRQYYENQKRRIVFKKRCST